MSRPKLTIRDAHESEVIALGQLLNDAHGESRPQHYVGVVQDRLAAPGSFGAVAVATDGVVGCIFLSPAREAFGAGEVIDGVGHLGPLGVHPQHWGQGFGSALLAAAVDHAGSVGYQSLQLYTDRDNIRACHLYEEKGWLQRGDPVIVPGFTQPLVRYVYLVEEWPR